MRLIDAIQWLIYSVPEHALSECLQPLAKVYGGVLILHDDFGEAFGVNFQRASSRAAGFHGLLEIRCSDNQL